MPTTRATQERFLKARYERLVRRVQALQGEGVLPTPTSDVEKLAKTVEEAPIEDEDDLPVG